MIEKEVHGKYADEITEAEERLDGIVGDLGEWEEETSALWETISDELQERSPEQKEFDFPRSEAPGVTDRFVLFDSRRDYLEQMDAYNAWKEGDEE